MVLENLLGHLQERPWWKVGEMYLLVSNKYDHRRSRLDIEYTFLSNGRSEVRYGSHQAYRYAELRQTRIPSRSLQRDDNRSQSPSPIALSLYS